MSPRAALALTALLATLLAVPPVQASVSVWDDEGASDSATQSSGPAGFQVDFTLRLSGSGNLQMFTNVEGQGGAVDHTAVWNLGGGRTTTRTSSAVVDGVPVGQEVAVHIDVTLPGTVPAGQYVLETIVRQRASGGSGESAITDSAYEATPLTLNRPAPGGGGGGGGGEGGDGDGAEGAGLAPLGSVAGFGVRAVQETGVSLEWDPVPGQGVSYVVYRSQQPGVEVTLANVVGSPAAPRFDDSDLQPGTSYYYRVRAADALGREGPISPEVSARTASPADRTPPVQVSGVTASRVEDRSVSLAWSDVQDEGAISYEVHRGAPGFTPSTATRVGVTASLGHTDVGLQPATTYSYLVRAVDLAGNAGPYSAPLDVATVRAPNDRPPAITRIQFLDEGAGWQVLWATDERTTGFVQVSGGVDRSATLPARASFAADVGDLPAGTYTYSIRATDDSGQVTEATGRLAIEAGLGGRLTAVGADLADGLGTRLGIDVEATSAFFVDEDLDGTFERLVDATGRMRFEHAVPSLERYLVSARGERLLVGTDGSLTAVEATKGTVGARTTTEAVERVEVKVADKQGWILVSLDDPAPEMPLLGVERADGEPLPDGSAWRVGSKVFILDDPETTYVLVFDNAPDARIPAKTDGLPGWIVYAAAAAGLLAGVLVTVLLMRRRPA